MELCVEDEVMTIHDHDFLSFLRQNSLYEGENEQLIHADIR